MPRRIPFAALFFALSLTPAFAQTRTGYLVDADCFTYAEHNVNADDTDYADRDTTGELRSCHPTAKTKSFAVVDQDFRFFKLDAAGNAKAAELVDSNAPKWLVPVTVTGQLEKDTLLVASIFAAK